MPLDDIPVVDDAIAIDHAEYAITASLERLETKRVGFCHLTSRVDFVVEHDQHTFAAGLRFGGDAKPIEQVGCTFVSKRARVAHRSHDHDRLVAANGQVEEVGRLLERVGSARDDHAGEL